MTAPTPDAVAQAREMISFCINDPHFKAEDSDECHWDGMPWPCRDAERNARQEERVNLWLDKYRDALIAAVRAECAAKVRGFGDAYPTDVWPETPFSDAQAASVMRLMVPRILATLEAHP